MSVLDYINLNGARYDIQDTKAQAMLAPTEASSTASAARAAGSYFIYNGALYKATADIASGGTIMPGTNCAAVTGGLTGDVSGLKAEAEGLRESGGTEYSVDITNRFTFTEGKGVKYSDGMLYDNASASYSNYVDVSEFDKFKLTARFTTSETRAGYAFYNASYGYISGQQDFYGANANTYAVFENVIPSGAKYIRVTWYPASMGITGFSMIGTKVGEEYERIKNTADAARSGSVLEYWGNDVDRKVINDTRYELSIGIKREGEVITLNKDKISPNDVRVGIGYDISRKQTAAQFTALTKSIPLVEGKTYKFSYEKISGTSIDNGVIRDNCSMFIRNSSDATVGRFNKNVPSVIVPWETGYGNALIMLWINKDVLYDNYKFRLRIEEVDTDQTEDKYKAEVDQTISSVQALMTEPCLVFPLVTDIHYLSVGDYERLFDHTVENIKRFAKHVRCDGLVCLGDITDGGQGDTIPNTEAEGIPIIDHIMDEMSSIGLPLYFSMGNHDDFRYMTTGLTAGETYAHYMSRSNADVIPDTDSTANGTNYYKDFPGYKVRLICINTNKLPTSQSKGTYGLSSHTNTWLGDVLSDMPSDWIGMIMTHVPIYSDLRWPDSAAVSNDATVCATIKNSGKTCFVVSGHTHFDASLKHSTYGFWHIVTNCNKLEARSEDNEVTTQGGQTAYRYARSIGNYTADLWDVLVIRPLSQKINFVRCGCGIDREFDLSSGT